MAIKISFISFISAGLKNTLSFGYMLNFLYLCSAEEHHIFMSQNTRSFGAEIEGSFDGKSRFSAPDAAKAPVILASRSQQNLPSTLAAITARFSCISGSLTFSSKKSNFQYMKVAFSLVQNPSFISPPKAYYLHSILCKLLLPVPVTALHRYSSNFLFALPENKSIYYIYYNIYNI